MPDSNLTYVYYYTRNNFFILYFKPKTVSYK